MEFCMPCGPTGRLTGSSDCKVHPAGKGEAGASADNTPPDQDCLEYEYDGVSILRLKHVNAGFNCCPDSFTAAFEFDGQQITITEVEWLRAPCDCLCLYDLDLRITGLPAGTWTIKVVEPYLWPEAEPLEFTVDLVASPSGEYCVTRDRYPWRGQ